MYLTKDSIKNIIQIAKRYKGPISLSYYLNKKVEYEDIAKIWSENFFVRKYVTKILATHLRDQFLTLYHENDTPGVYSIDKNIVAKRTLKNVCLSYLVTLNDPLIRKLCMHQFKQAANMTDSICSLKALSNIDCPERIEALSIFYEKWKNNTLVINKWLEIQAQSDLKDTLNQVKFLLCHSCFNIKNPNNVKALIGNFCNNRIHFHAPSGEGYHFLATQLLIIDSFNPQLASSLFEPLTHWKHYDDKRQALMKMQIETILSKPNISIDVYEMATKSLHD